MTREEVKKQQVLRTEELMKMPVLRVKDGESTVMEFSGYDQAYIWAREHRENGLLGALIGNATMVLLFGECPIRYDVSKRETEFFTGYVWKKAV